MRGIAEEDILNKFLLNRNPTLQERLNATLLQNLQFVFMDPVHVDFPGVSFQPETDRLIWGYFHYEPTAQVFVMMIRCHFDDYYDLDEYARNLWIKYGLAAFGLALIPIYALTKKWFTH